MSTPPNTLPLSVDGGNITNGTYPMNITDGIYANITSNFNETVVSTNSTTAANETVGSNSTGPATEETTVPQNPTPAPHNLKPSLPHPIHHNWTFSHHPTKNHTHHNHTKTNKTHSTNITSSHQHHHRHETLAPTISPYPTISPLPTSLAPTKLHNHKKPSSAKKHLSKINKNSTVGHNKKVGHNKENSTNSHSMFHSFGNPKTGKNNDHGISPVLLVFICLSCIVAYLGWNKWNRHRRGLTYSRGVNELELATEVSTASSGAVQVQEGDGQWNYRAPTMDAPAEGFRQIS